MSEESSLPIYAQERIAERLIRFSRALKSDDDPLIEDYHEGFAGRERVEMLTQLILTEADYHADSDKLVSFEDNHDRFPEDAELIAAAEREFFEPASPDGREPLRLPGDH